MYLQLSRFITPLPAIHEQRPFPPITDDPVRATGSSASLIFEEQSRWQPLMLDDVLISDSIPESVIFTWEKLIVDSRGNSRTTWRRPVGTVRARNFHIVSTRDDDQIVDQLTYAPRLAESSAAPDMIGPSFRNPYRAALSESPPSAGRNAKDGKRCVKGGSPKFR